MRLTTAGMLLALAGLAVAAPVPKHKPVFGDFGDLTDPKTKCKCELSKDGTLTITVPTEQLAVEVKTNGVPPPVVGRKVEGDFVATIRLKPKLPKLAGRASADVEDAAIGIGLAVFAENDPKHGAAVTALWKKKESGWGAWEVFWQREPKKFEGRSETGLDVDGDAHFCFRATRKGKNVDFEMSKDGVKWHWVHGSTFDKLPDTTTVGPVAFGSIDQQFSATFDQYEIKPLTKDEKK